MKIFVLGATGGVGQHVVDQALAAGHTVTASARSALSRTHEFLTVVTGDATEAGVLRGQVVGHDAVICCVGGGLSDRTTRTEATRHLVGAMGEHGVRRLVLVSSLGAGDSYGRVGFATKAIVKTLLRNAIHDHNGQEDAVKAAGDAIAATVLRPGGLSDEPPQAYTTVVGGQGALSGKGRIARAAVAEVALQALSEPTWEGTSVAVLPA